MTGGQSLQGQAPGFQVLQQTWKAEAGLGNGQQIDASLSGHAFHRLQLP